MEDIVAEREFTFTYKNWRGEVATRRAFPLRMEFKSTEWHPEPQWLLIAWDVEKEAERDFAVKDINPAPNMGAPVTLDGLPPFPWKVERSPEWTGMYDADDNHIISYTNADNGLHAAPGVLEAIVATMNAKAAPQVADAPVQRVFPRFLRTETNTVATFIMEDGVPGPVACLTGDNHAERGRAIIHAVMSSGLTMTAAAKLVARLAELEEENRTLKAKIGEETNGQRD